MKTIIIVPDGMCDWRYEQLGNQSPAEYAPTPGMDAIVRRGRVGLSQTMYEGLPMGSLVGFLGILGYYPPDYFPLGRAVFEGLARGVDLHPEDVAFRCNIVRVNGDDSLADFTAGQISDEEAEAYLEQITLPDSFEIHHDFSYRNVLVWCDTMIDPTRINLAEPHENIGEPIASILPHFDDKPYPLLIDMIHDSRRGDLMLWPWGATRIRQFPPVPYKLTLITGLSFLYGMGLAFGGQPIMPPGTNGYLNTNLPAKLESLIEHFDDFEVGVIHCNAPDEEAHVKNLERKVQAVTNIDQQVISPLLDFLDGRDQAYQVLLIPDHYTTCADGRHQRNPVPYAVYGSDITPDHSLTAYSEIEITARNGEVIESHRLLERLRAGV